MGARAAVREVRILRIGDDADLKHAAGFPPMKKNGDSPVLRDQDETSAYLISPIEMLRYSTFIFTPPCTWRPTGAALG